MALAWFLPLLLRFQQALLEVHFLLLPFMLAGTPGKELLWGAGEVALAGKGVCRQA